MPKKISFFEKVEQKFYLLLANDDFVKDARVLRKKYRLDDIENRKVSVNDGPSAKEILGLLKKYKLSENYYPLVYRIIAFELLTKLEDIKKLFRPVELKIEENPRSGIQHFYLEIYPETTIKDVQAFWKTAQQQIHKTLSLPVKKMPHSKNMERDLRLLKWREKYKISDRELKQLFNNVYTNTPHIKSGTDIRFKGYRLKMRSKSSFNLKNDTSKES